MAISDPALWRSYRCEYPKDPESLAAAVSRLKVNLLKYGAPLLTGDPSVSDKFNRLEGLAAEELGSAANRGARYEETIGKAVARFHAAASNAGAESL